MMDGFIESAERSAYKIVCKMIDSGFIDSEPEGQMWEHEITAIIRNTFGI